jgi:predicted metal-dependent hydrolase
MSEIPYEVVRSDRKTIALVIDSDAKLIVRAPLRAKNKDISGFIEKKRHWIEEKQKQVLAFGEKHSPVIVANGESLIFMGSTYTILLEDVTDIQISGVYILIPLDGTTDSIIEWMKKEALTVLKERVERYAQIMGVKYSAIKLSDAKARWGSCSVKNSLNFAWRLIMCPLPVIDYIVVHELSHIAYKNHSASFWARVRTILTDYKESQDWLKINRKLMEII